MKHKALPGRLIIARDEARSEKHVYMLGCQRMHPHELASASRVLKSTSLTIMNEVLTGEKHRQYTPESLSLGV